MPGLKSVKPFQIHILDTPDEMTQVEDLQRLVWPGNETDIVPSHLLITAASNGGVVMGAYDSVAGTTIQETYEDETRATISQHGMLVGFVFGFPGLYSTADGLRLKHCSHMLGVHPSYRDRGLGFALKRAQWQIVRHQGIDLITWTYDPLQSRNANLNIASLGAVCDTYQREAYGQMRDGLNAGLPSDRFKVDWWVNSQRVVRKLSKKPRKKLDLAHYLAAEIEIINPTSIGQNGFPQPSGAGAPGSGKDSASLLLLEIPSDYQAIKSADPSLALEWRLHFRAYCEYLFGAGYLVTDFVYLAGNPGRSFYVLSHGLSTL